VAPDEEAGVRILHLLKTSHGAGWAIRQMRELVGMGIDVHVAMPSGGPRIEQCREAGITVHLLPTDFPVRRPWTLPGVLSGLRRVVATVNPDVIHSHFFGTTLTARLSLGRNYPIPRVFQVPGPLHLEGGPYGRIEMGLAGPRDHWIASCSWTRNKYLALGVPSDRVHLSFYGTDILPFLSPDAGRLRRELNLSGQTVLVGMVAYMYPPKYYLGQFRGLKGHEDFFAAMVQVRKRRPDALAVIVGTQWGDNRSYERRLQRLGCRLLGNAVVFLGHRTDVPSIYADLDLAVYPSLSENLGGAGESLLAGVPTVATRVGGLPDVVRAGETGWLVPPHSPQQLAEAILEALADRREAQRRARAGQRLVREIGDVRRTAREVLAIYEHVLGVPASPRRDPPPRQHRAAA
jgi:glycosyltransferase involved in cell wall biosynthesis